VACPIAAILFVSACVDKKIIDSKTIDQELSLRKSSTLTIAFWGNLHLISSDCGCSITPFGGQKRRQKALEELAQSSQKPDFIFDTGDVLLPNDEPIKAKQIKKVIAAAQKHSRDAVHFSPDEVALLKKYKIPAPENAVYSGANQKPRELRDHAGNAYTVYASSPDAPLNPTEINPNTFPIILSTHSAFKIDALAKNIRQPFLILGSNDRMEGPICLSKGLGLLCMGVWRGKTINVLQIDWPPQANAMLKLQPWVNINQLKQTIDRYEDTKKNAPDDLKNVLADFDKEYPHDLKNAFLYKVNNLILDNKYGKPGS